MNRQLPFALVVTVLGVALFLSPLAAQVRGGHFSAVAPRGGVSYGARARGGYGYGSWGQRRFSPGWGYLPFPYYPDYDYDYGPPYPTQAPPPWAVVQPEQPPVPPKPIESLVLERQGDQWVRIGGYGQSQAGEQSMPPSAGQAPNPSSELAGRNNAAQPPPVKLPPAVLVFRDGHQEEINRYSIIGPVIYTRGDYWTTGSWTRKVAIADLDIPATLELNRERGGKFSLPSGPNEVVVRP